MPEIKLSEDRVLLAFVDQLITDKGMNLAGQERAKVRVQLKSQLDNAIEEAMLAALPDAQLLELGKKVDAGASDEEIEKIFESANIDYDALAKKTLEEFRKQVMAGEVEIPAVEVTETTEVIEAPVGLEPTTEPTVEVTAAPAPEAAAPAAPVVPVAEPTVAAPVAETTVPVEPVVVPTVAAEPTTPAMEQPVAQPVAEAVMPAAAPVAEQPVVAPQSTMTDQNTQAQQIEQAINDMNAMGPAAEENR